MTGSPIELWSFSHTRAHIHKHYAYQNRTHDILASDIQLAEGYIEFVSVERVPRDFLIKDLMSYCQLIKDLGLATEY